MVGTAPLAVLSRSGGPRGGIRWATLAWPPFRDNCLVWGCLRLYITTQYSKNLDQEFVHTPTQSADVIANTARKYAKMAVFGCIAIKGKRKDGVGTLPLAKVGVSSSIVPRKVRTQQEKRRLTTMATTYTGATLCPLTLYQPCYPQA